MQKGLIFSESLQQVKYLKSCLPKGTLLDTTILLISISIIKIGRLYLSNLYSSISMSSNFYIFLSIFIYGFNFFSDVFNLKFSTLPSKFLFKLTF